MASIDYLVLGQELRYLDMGRTEQALIHPGLTLVYVRGVAAHFSLGASFGIRIPWNELGASFKIECDIVNASGQTIRTTSKPFASATITADPDSVIFRDEDQQFATNVELNSITIQKPGKYAVTVAINGKESARADFRVLLYTGVLAG